MAKLIKGKTFIDSKWIIVKDFKKRSERQEQVALFKNIKAFESTYPELRLFFAIPNGGKRSPQYGAMMKAQGLKSGVPDTFLPVPRYSTTRINNYHGLFGELKVGSNKPNDIQKNWHQSLKAQGYKVCVWYSAEQALDDILEYVKS